MSTQNATTKSLDPLKALHEDVWDNIFIHLSPKDVKQCSLVAPAWKNTLVASQAAKFWLKIDSKWTNMTTEEREAIVQSRGFQHVFIFQATDISDSLPRLMSLQRLWKNVSISGAEFSSIANFTEFIEVFRKTVENLTIAFVTVKGNDRVETIFHFPNLKVLDISVCDDIAYHCDCPALTSLKIFDPTAAYEGTITKMLMSMNMLKSLVIHRSLDQWLDIIFTEEHDGEFPFQLDYLELINIWSEKFNSNIEPFKRFLMAQSNSIKTLKLHDQVLADRTIWKIAFGMKCLKTFATRYIPEKNPTSDPLDLPKNYSIETLYMHEILNCHQMDQLLEIIKATPNIIELKLRSIYTALGDYIEQNLHKLRLATVSQDVCDIFCYDIEAKMPSFDFKINHGTTEILRKVEN